jgi:hypothetical protein
MEEFIPITLFMCIAAVAILRPISTRVGRLLEAITRDRLQSGRSPEDSVDVARLRTLMEHISRRMDLIEERMDFTERLAGGSRRPAPLREDSLRGREEMLHP